MAASAPEELLSSVLSQYPLSDLSVVGPMEAGRHNDNVLIEDAAGNRYVLRHYGNLDDPRVLFQLRFQQELHRRGFPTSEVIESASGSLLVRKEAGSWVLFTYVEGTEYDFARTGQVAKAGRRLADFHTVSASIELEEVIVDANPKPRRWWSHGEEELAALQEMFADDAVAEELAFLREWRADLVSAWPLDRLDALPASWVHGDYHGSNMVFVGDEVRGLFDFDTLHRGFSVEDIGHALTMFAREFRGSRRIRSDAARRFLDAYDHHRPMRKEEREALPMMAVLAWAGSPANYRMLQRDGEDTLAFFRHYVSLMRDLQVEMERLAPVLAKG